MTTDFLPNIENFVFLMLENRSFDNLMGWLYENDHPAQIIPSPGTDGPGFMGLQSGVAAAHNVRPIPIPKNAQERKRALRTPDPDPHEPYLHVNKQLFNIDVPPCGERDHPPVTPQPGSIPKMDGFLADYQTTRTGRSFLPNALGVIADECGWLGKLARLLSKEISPGEAEQILETYPKELLPVITGLAREYAVSDEWFSSVPTQTNSNRAFSTSGTSAGLTDNKGRLFGFVPDSFNVPSIWDRLSEAGHDKPLDWMIYYQQKLFWKYVFTEEAFSVPDAKNHVAHIDKFFDAIETDSLPKFSYLEPIWLGAHIGNNGNSYHPPAQLEPGEDFVAKLVDKLRANPKQWEKTLLMITFDEHGGTFDHVPPPWGAMPPWGVASDGFAPLTPPLEHDFGFDRFGVRVPTILASPWIEAETVFRSTTDVPYDHTSMIATVLTWMGVDRDNWNLGERVAHAPTFEGVLTRSTPRPSPHKGTASTTAD